MDALTLYTLKAHEPKYVLALLLGEKAAANYVHVGCVSDGDIMNPTVTPMLSKPIALWPKGASCWICGDTL